MRERIRSRNEVAEMVRGRKTTMGSDDAREHASSSELERAQAGALAPEPTMPTARGDEIGSHGVVSVQQKEEGVPAIVRGKIRSQLGQAICDAGVQIEKAGDPLFLTAKMVWFNRLRDMGEDPDQHVSSIDAVFRGVGLRKCYEVLSELHGATAQEAWAAVAAYFYNKEHERALRAEHHDVEYVIGQDLKKFVEVLEDRCTALGESDTRKIEALTLALPKNSELRRQARTYGIQGNWTLMKTALLEEAGQYGTFGALGSQYGVRAVRKPERVHHLGNFDEAGLHGLNPRKRLVKCWECQERGHAVPLGSYPWIDVHAEWGGLKVRTTALVDTGALSTWMSDDLADRLGLLRRKTHTQALGPTNEVLGEAEESVAVIWVGEGIQSEESVWIMRNLGPDLILGMRFLAKHVSYLIPGRGLGLRSGGWITFVNRDVSIAQEAVCHTCLERHRILGSMYEEAKPTVQLEAVHYIADGAEVKKRIQALEEKYAGHNEAVCTTIEAKIFEHLDEAQSREMKGLLKKFWVLFRPELGKTDLVEHTIRIKPERLEDLPRAKLRRRAPAVTQAEREMVQGLVARGVLEPSLSDVSSQNVMVKKPNGGWRLTTDFRTLNDATVKDRYPIPDVGEMIDWFASWKFKSILDLKDGFFQVPLAPESRPLTAIITPDGLFQYCRLPQGCCNSPSTFQRLTNTVLGPLRYLNALVYIDDLAIGTKTFEEHLQALQRVLEQFCAAGLVFSLSKCRFGALRVEFLGHDIGLDGIRPSQRKTEAVRAWQEPRNAKELQQFIGLVGWFRNFIEGFEEVCRPLRDAMKGLQINAKGSKWKKYPMNSADWQARFGEPQSQAFLSLREALSDPETGDRKVLAAYDPEAEHTLWTDASSTGLGAMLTQREGTGDRPVAFYSRLLRPAEQNYTVTEKECLAAIAAMEHFRHYLYGKRFVLMTDHSALSWLMRQKEPQGRIARWILKVQDFDFQVQHHPGKANTVADALSRPAVRMNGEEARVASESNKSETLNNTSEIELIGLNAVEDEEVKWVVRLAEMLQEEIQGPASGADGGMVPVTSAGVRELLLHTGEHTGANDAYTPPSMEEIVAAYADDTDIQEQLKNLKADKPEYTYPEYTVDEDGVIWAMLRDESRVVIPNALVQRVLHVYHSTPLSGHLGIEKTAKRVSDARYWWTGWTEDVRQFVLCCHECFSRKTKAPPRRARMQVYRAVRRFEIVSIDVLSITPTTTRGHSKVVIMVDAFTKWVRAHAVKDETAATLARVFLDGWVCDFGPPESLLSDRGPGFVADILSKMCENLGVGRMLTTAYHPQTNGVVERFNQTVCQMLSAYVCANGKDWDRWLPVMVYAYNTARHASTKMSPFELLYGEPARDWASMAGPRAVEQADDLAKKLAACHAIANKNAKIAQDRYTKNYDRRVREHDFKPGDVVYVWAPPSGEGRKLKKPWVGPLSILRMVGVHAVLCSEGHPDGKLVHVNRLARAHKDLLEASGSQVLQGEDGSWAIEAIAGDRVVGGRREYRVRWRGLGKRGDTWEPELALPPMMVAAYRDA
ncbi:Transposon Ty3-I Gag-Pol polyprotein [Porphyridium purpureum]|uniref:RNA-directed DNA polymerase n=1 Tax=Porphyridium purpureum TaxID=35688 RepID=A0A5J4YIX3_PORPP|nr:Transposon Ty3-I Gag-Pol polyprotein [Porphyridium purpureum]|eukprot:POR2008..scf251_18